MANETTKTDATGDGPPHDPVTGEVIEAPVATQAIETKKGDGNKSKSTAITAAQADGQFKAMFEKALPSIGAIASKHLSPERLLRVALVARSKVPMLRECTPQSFLQALMQAAEVGLEPNTPLQHAWLAPYKNKKTGTTEAQLMIGYKGLVHLARRSGVAVTVRARLIREHDTWEIEEGTERKLVHRPNLADGGEVIIGYAIAELKGGGVEWEAMTRSEMDAIRGRSMASNSGPWVDFTDMMYRKTVLRRLLSQLDLTEEMASALDVENRSEAESDSTVVDILAGAGSGAVSSDRGDDLAGEIRKGGRR